MANAILRSGLYAGNLESVVSAKARRGSSLCKKVFQPVAPFIGGVLFFIAPLVSVAAPIGWWRFEGTPGAVIVANPQHNQEIANAIDGSSQVAVFGTRNDSWVKYEKAFYGAPRCAFVGYEGGSDVETFENKSSFSNTNWEYRCSAHVRIADSSALAESFTIEAFFRYEPTVSSFNNYYRAPFARASVTNHNQYAFSLSFHGSETIHFSANGGIAGGAAVDCGSALLQGVSDGQWHHLAFVYDCEKSRAVLYYDYVAVLTKEECPELKGFDPNDPYPLTIGTNGATGDNCWCGEIDEIRLSQGALTRDELLFKDIGGFKPMYGETIGWWRMEDGEKGAPATDLVNEIDKFEGVEAFMNRMGNPDAAVYDDSFGLPVNFSEGEVANDRCLCATGKASRLNVQYVQIDDHPFLGGDSFTCEGFFRWDRRNPEWFSRYWRGLMSKISPDRTKMIWGLSWQTINASDTGHHATNPFRFYMNGEYCKTGSTVLTHDLPSLDNGQWHHVAVTYDAENSRARVWYDYQCVMEWNDCPALPRTYDRFGDSGCPIYFGSNGTSDSNFFGWYDEIRYTAGALQPESFLQPKTVAVKGGDCLAYFSFDGGLESSADGGAGRGFAAEAFALLNAVEDSRLPKYDSSVWKLSVDDGEGNRRQNVSALEFCRSELYVPIRSVPSLRNRVNQATVEFFYRPASSVEGREIIQSRSTHGASPIWRLIQNGEGGLDLKMKNTSWIDYGASGRFGLSLNKWHHVAITIDASVAGSVKATIWVDYKEYAKGTASGELNYGEVFADLDVGKYVNESIGSYMGLIDELRVSCGLLPPEKFLRAIAGGLLILLK